eukprot:gnl/TRDRNA2_/TRDRNA2_163842_c0_seq3.p2 gnl/TRDRNA2_/TRDRNA2_163842_c0~~gnl/TRDRNA2_/TRDRNA2_163842_c0_seq3.p2  ORF type:complete len:124 (-),score=14.68 gnl/TRDRNA2_/TRDRNA2_163842_c0_seq3:144-515(-)
MLEDGSRLPAKKPFSNCRYDASTRTFCATIHWDIPFQSRTREEFEMVFAEDFSRVVGGHLSYYGADGQLAHPEMSYGDPLRPEGFFQRGLSYVRKPGVLMGEPKLHEAASTPTLSTMLSEKKS